jgi:hypothetical protein
LTYKVRSKLNNPTFPDNKVHIPIVAMTHKQQDQRKPNRGNEFVYPKYTLAHVFAGILGAIHFEASTIQLI